MPQAGPITHLGESVSGAGPDVGQMLSEYSPSGTERDANKKGQSMSAPSPLPCPLPPGQVLEQGTNQTLQIPGERRRTPVLLRIGRPDHLQFLFIHLVGDFITCQAPCCGVRKMMRGAVHVYKWWWAQGGRWGLHLS